MSLTQARELVEQVQIAHRLAVGFYQRLLPLLSRIASELELQFWFWEPAQTDRPCPSSTPPNNKWKWDFVPLFASRHAFWRIAGEQAQRGDCAVLFSVYLDEDFKPERRKALGLTGQPDPLALQGSAMVEVYVYRCTADAPSPFQKLWTNSSQWPPAGAEGWHDISSALEAMRLRFELAAFIAEPEGVIAAVRQAMAATR